MTMTVVTNRQSCDVAGGDATIHIALLRHAQKDLHGCFCGHSDPSLSVQGREQLPAIIQNLSQIVPSAIWSSDLRRARETAEPIAKHFGLGYKISPDFREMNFGNWEGLTWKEVELQYPDDARDWAKLFPHHRPPGGESFLELQVRAADQLEQLAKHAEPGCTLVVTHAGFIRTAVAWVLGVPGERISRIGQNHGALTTLEKQGNHWSVTALNVSASRFPDARRKETKDQL
ncbi:MAG TPA: histidine phosphatase family protein [Bryobacteraceae bacterium]|nr:histidine phosphatase family protein [Bryobacteraceae bacterium]